MNREPRIFPRRGHFHCAIWMPTTQTYMKRSTKIELDIDAPDDLAANPDWWKKSKYAAHIRTFVEKMKFAKLDALRGQPLDRRPYKHNLYTLTLDELLTEYNTAKDDERGKRSPKTYEQLQNAVDAFKRYFPRSRVPLVTRKQALEFRNRMETAQYSPHTIRGYLRKLQAMYKYAIREGYVKGNPFEDITIRIKSKPPKRISRESEYRLYTFIWQHKRPLFYQLVFARVTGFRSQDVCDFEHKFIDIEHDLITYDNQKGVRFEEYPLTKAARKILTMAPRIDKKFVFEYRDRKTVYSYLQMAAKHLKMPAVSAHDLKRFYGQELVPHTESPTLFDALMHHSPTTSKVAVDYYTGRNLIMMRDVLDRAQAHWLPFIESLEGLPEITDANIKFSNPNSHANKYGKRVLGDAE